MVTAVSDDWRTIWERIMADTSTGAAENTKRLYSKHLAAFFKVVNAPQGVFAYADFERYLQAYIKAFPERHGRPCPPGTQNGIKAAVKFFIKQGVRIDLLPPEMLAVKEKLVMAKKSVVRKAQKVKPTLTYERFDEYRRHMDELHLLLADVHWETARRTNEACSIMWDDVDFDNLRIYFRNVKRGNPGYSSVSPELMDRLKAWKRKQDAGEAKVGNRTIPPSQFVFSATGNASIEGGSFTRYLRSISARANLPPITAHVLRGSGALHLRKVAGWRVDLVMKQGGWESFDTLNLLYFRDEIDERVALRKRQTTAKEPPPQPQPESQGVPQQTNAVVTPEVIEAISKLAPEAQKVAIERLLG
jgi:integrase